MDMSVIGPILVLGVATNMTAMAWIMKTLYQLRQEISGTHSRHDEQLVSMNARISRLERLNDDGNKPKSPLL